MWYFNKYNIRWLVFFSIFLFVLCIVPKIHASQETTISVAPAILDLAVKPGEKTEAELTIRNGGGFALPISVASSSLIIEDEIVVTSEKETSDASSWIGLEESEFLLSDDEIKKVTVTIDVPESASPGGHYAQISVRGLSLEESRDVGASIVIPEVAVTVLITVAGDINTSMSVSGESIIPVFATPSTNHTTDFTVVNEGNIHDLLTPVLVVKKEKLNYIDRN